MTSQTGLIALAAACLLAFAGGWKLRDYQAQGDAFDAANAALSSVQKALVARDLLTAADAMKSRTLEESLAAMRATRTETQIVREKEYVEATVYARCVVPPDGVRLLNARVAARRPAARPGER